MGVIFSEARAALVPSPPPLNSKPYWSFSALDAVEKSNYLSLTRDGAIGSSPHTSMALHGHDMDNKKRSDNFLPYGQAGWVVNTEKNRKKLEHRATPANYLRCISKDNYQVY